MPSEYYSDGPYSDNDVELVAGNVGAYVESGECSEEEALEQVGRQFGPSFRERVRARRNARKQNRGDRRSQRLADDLMKIASRGPGAPSMSSMESAVESTFEGEFAGRPNKFIDAIYGEEWRRRKTVVFAGFGDSTQQNSTQSIPAVGKAPVTFVLKPLKDVEIYRIVAGVPQALAATVNNLDTLLAGFLVLSCTIANDQVAQTLSPLGIPLSSFLQHQRGWLERVVLKQSQSTGLAITIAQAGSGANGTLGAAVDLSLGAFVGEVTK